MVLPSTDGSTSSSLLGRARSQDPDAWRTLSQIYGPMVYRWARQSGLQESDSADLVQEVFQAVATGLSTFRYERASDSFRGWLWGITRHKILDQFRRLASAPRAAGGSDIQHLLQQIPEESLDVSTADPFDPVASLLYRALDQLRGQFEEHTWQAFWRATIDGERASEIAADLGMTAKAVRQAKYRVLRKLRIEVEGIL